MKARLPATHERDLLGGRTDRVLRRLVVLRGLRRGALPSVTSAMVSLAPSEAPQVLFIDLNMIWACGTRALSSAAAADN